MSILNTNNSNITFWLLLFVSCLMINTTLACTTISSCASVVNSTNSTTSVQAHWEALDREILELTCHQNRLTNVLSLLKINSTLNNEIIVIRSKHLEKITKAITLLTQESSYLKLANSKSLISRNGQPYEYLDGSRAKSCYEYRYATYYNNQGSGLYNIEPSNGDIITVYCDMITDGGGWTLVSGVRNDYGGVHFHVFEDSTATSTSTFTSFHIKTTTLLTLSTQVRAAADSSSNPITTFYQSNWSFSVHCTITTALRNAIRLISSNNQNGDLPANCVILSGGPFTTPTHYTYGRSINGHSIGFRMGVPFGGDPGHIMNGYATYSYAGAPEGGTSSYNMGTYNLGEGQRNGAIFLR